MQGRGHQRWYSPFAFLLWSRRARESRQARWDRLAGDTRLDIPVTSRYDVPPTLYDFKVSTVHTKSEKDKLLARVRRVRGQIEAVERALEGEKGCATVLHLIVAARGAMSSLMTEVIEDHIRLHIVDPTKDAERVRGAEELIEAVQAYLK
jgi:FrmR/RcnR family transcriptional regulator, repressor of frmRAB operon